MERKTKYEIHTIGTIIHGEDGICVQLEPRYSAGLSELVGFSHVHVLWWCHENDTEERLNTLVCDQPYVRGPKQIGVFATRSQFRPNLIAMTPVMVARLDIEQGRIYTPFLDADEGSPVLDIKPYHPCMDRIREASVPKWCDHWPKWYEDNADFDWAAEFNFDD